MGSADTSSTFSKGSSEKCQLLLLVLHGHVGVGVAVGVRTAVCVSRCRDRSRSHVLLLRLCLQWLSHNGVCLNKHFFIFGFSFGLFFLVWYVKLDLLLNLFLLNLTLLNLFLLNLFLLNLLLLNLLLLNLLLLNFSIGITFTFTSTPVLFVARADVQRVLFRVLVGAVAVFVVAGVRRWR